MIPGRAYLGANSGHGIVRLRGRRNAGYRTPLCSAAGRPGLTIETGHSQGFGTASATLPTVSDIWSDICLEKAKMDQTARWRQRVPKANFVRKVAGR